MTRMIPASGRSRKFRQRSSVVFPLPEEPIRDRTVPFSILKEISSRTSVEPKDFRMLCTSRIGINHKPPFPQRKKLSFFSRCENSSVRRPVKAR